MKTKIGLGCALYTFPKPAERQQIAQRSQVFLGNGITELRTNYPWTPRWDGRYLDPKNDGSEKYEYAEIAHELHANGLYYTIVGADANPSIAEKHPALVSLVMKHKKYDEPDAIRYITSMGVGLWDERIVGTLLNDIIWLRNEYPDSTTMQIFNGPENEGWGRWNAYDKTQRDEAVFLGIGTAQEGLAIRANYERFRDLATAIWGQGKVWRYGAHIYGTHDTDAWFNFNSNDGRVTYVSELGISRPPDNNEQSRQSRFIRIIRRLNLMGSELVSLWSGVESTHYFLYGMGETDLLFSWEGARKLNTQHPKFQSIPSEYGSLIWLMNVRKIVEAI